RGFLREQEGKLKAIADKPGPADRHLGPAELPERFAALIGVGALRRFDQALAALPVERQGAKVATHQDLSGLFLVRAVERYLKAGGRFAFVMPNAAVDRGQYSGLRTGRYQQEG